MEFRLLRLRIKRTVFFICALLSLSSTAVAAPADAQFILQQQRQQALEAQLTPQTPDVRLPSPANSEDSGEFAAETPCFTIHDVTLSGQDAFPHWVPLQRMANQVVGKCLGAKGINRVMSLLQNRLISHGWTTARVLAPAQDLKKRAFSAGGYSGEDPPGLVNRRQ
ncbi:POTRA domain, ShlB-type [Leclercia adecarboxylata]|uniref:POTRA domain, ShlB-type n=1 Tax=Leclercia adecarboxylata TaxID=83655 RepID=A0A4U9J064_9ENTR|nr:POTRA domain, ShlB-type [Leclercia adecarboxylata]